MMDRFIDLVFDLPVRQSFTYELPERLRERAKIGIRAQAPFGKSARVGVIIGPSPSVPDTGVRPIAGILDDTPIISPEMLKLGEWISTYYYCSLGETVRAAAGPQWSVVPRTIVYPAPDRWEKSAAELRQLSKTARDILAQLPGGKGVPLARLMEAIGHTRALKALTRLEHEGWVERRTVTRAVPIPADAQILGVGRGESDLLPDEALTALGALDEAGMIRREFVKATGLSDRKLSNWMREGLVRWRPATPQSGIEYDLTGLSLPLTDEQERGVAKLDELRQSKNPKPALIFGVTGSGKTRVYIDVARKLIQSGKRVLVLVPEIAMAQSAAGLWSLAFPGRVALWHSAMKSSNRYWVYRKVAEGEYDIVVGARSAIFAPLGDLGMIVVDEEHADTYKQSEPDPRYHARDTAVVRAQQQGCLCVLGSATPSVESFHNARQGKYHLVELTRRVPGRQLPVVHLVDLAGRRAAAELKSDAIFTSLLIKRIRETIEGGRQAILFLNRRGHSTMVTCTQCGWRLECPHCGITLTYHLTDHTHRCHICQFKKKAESTCPNCGNHKFGFRGAGTQKVEEQLLGLNPEWRVDRLDTDTATTAADAGKVLKRFSVGESDILVGTQMVAKGLDFARVGLVGVVWADRHLSFPDFRAEEKMFQLVTQVAGRSGRGKEAGIVVVQTFHPQHQLIELAAAQDYVGFFDREIGRRRELAYPPYTRLVRIEFSSTEEEAAYRGARTAVKELRLSLRQVPGTNVVLGPAPAPIMRVRERYRWRLLLKTRSVTTLIKGIEPLLADLEGMCRKQKDLRMVVDVDPIDFL